MVGRMKSMVRCIRRGAFVLWMALVSTPVAATPPVKILPIGDSITQGGQIESEYTYRLPLREQLSQDGVQADYIGTRSAGSNRQRNSANC